MLIFLRNGVWKNIYIEREIRQGKRKKEREREIREGKRKKERKKDYIGEEKERKRNY